MSGRPLPHPTRRRCPRCSSGAQRAARGDARGLRAEERPPVPRARDDDEKDLDVVREAARDLVADLALERSHERFQGQDREDEPGRGAHAPPGRQGPARRVLEALAPQHDLGGRAGVDQRERGEPV